MKRLRPGGRPMRIGLLVLVLCAVGVGAFWAGRLTAPAQRFRASETSADADVLAEAWSDFIRAQEEALELFRSNDFFGDDQERAEAYRGCPHPWSLARFG